MPVSSVEPPVSRPNGESVPFLAFHLPSEIHND